MGPIAFIVPALFNLAATGISHGIQARANEKARTESQAIAEQSRKDELKQQGFMNRLENQRLDLKDESLRQDEQYTKQSIGLQQQSDKYQQDVANKQGRMSAIQGMGDIEEGIAYKNRVLSRF